MPLPKPLGELALMRAIGASRRQVNRSVVIEAVAVGLVGSTIGLGLGVLFALALKALLSAFGVDLPTTGLAFHLRTVIASYLVGTGVTVAAAVGPARRAGRVALVAAFSVTGASLKSSFHRVFTTSLSADYIVTQSGFANGFSPSVAASLAHVPGVATGASERGGAARVAGDVLQLSAIQPEGLSQVLQFRVLAGEQSALARGQLLVSHTLGADKKWTVGQRLPVTFARTGPTTLTVGGIYRDNRLAGDLLVSTSLYASHFSQQLDQVVLVRTVPHAGADTRTAITRALGAFPTVKVQTQKEYLKTAEARSTPCSG